MHLGRLPLPRGWRDARPFAPILAGATLRDRAVTSLGAGLGIALAGLVGLVVLGDDAATPWIVAPVGASAVLVFAVPASPMAQPWPVVGGLGLSALVGICVGRVLGDGAVAAGLAVALAIGVMSLTRCLHPPGGAAALLAVLGGSAVDASGWLFPLMPVAMGGAVLVVTGWAFHKLSGHAYPHVPRTTGATSDPPPSLRPGVAAEDLDAVLARLGETFDISRDDLGMLLSELDARVFARERADLTCGEIMSRDVLAVERNAEPEAARRLLLESGVRLLPVLDGARRPVGGVGLRELARPGHVIGDVMAPPLTTPPDAPVSELVRPLTDGHRHAAMVVDDDGRLVGLVSQADLLAALARPSGRARPQA